RLGQVALLGAQDERQRRQAPVRRREQDAHAGRRRARRAVRAAARQQSVARVAPRARARRRAPLRRAARRVARAVAGVGERRQAVARSRHRPRRGDQGARRAPPQMSASWIDALAARASLPPELVAWARTQPDLQTAWSSCDRLDWMIDFGAARATDDTLQRALTYAGCSLFSTDPWIFRLRPAGVRVARAWATRGTVADLDSKDP